MGPTVMYYKSWNTQRLYTEHGQRLGYAVLTNNVLIFNDIDRGLTGHVKADFMPIDSHPRRIEHAYMQGEGKYYWSNPDDMPYDIFKSIADKAGKYAEQHAPSLKQGSVMGIVLFYVLFVIGIETTIVETNDIPYPLYTETMEEGQPPVAISVTDTEVGA